MATSMNSRFFKTSTTWVVDFHYDGHPRRWFKAFGANVDVKSEMTSLLQDLYGGRAKLVEVRPATEDEEGDYLRGTEPKNVMCPTGRRGPPDHEA
jgi:hypothetical protein